MPAPSIVGLMVTRSSRWVLRAYLSRHANMFELLAVLDGSPLGSADAQWTARQCARHRNVLYASEHDANLTKVSDQTTRAAATRLLLRGLGVTGSRALEGRWIFLAHPDEFFVQDVRDIAALVEQRDRLATIVLFDIVFVMPTPTERDAIVALHGDGDGENASSFEPIDALAHCDAAYPFREPRLFKWTRGTAWGKRHGITTPELHPGRRQWPTAREVAQRATPFYVHFKVHDFGRAAFELRSDRQHGGAWISFRSSGFATGLARHRAHGAAFHVSPTGDAHEQIASYYERAGRSPSALRGEIRKRCGGALVRCSVPWRAGAGFGARRSVA